MRKDDEILIKTTTTRRWSLSARVIITWRYITRVARPGDLRQVFFLFFFLSFLLLVEAYLFHSTARCCIFFQRFTILFFLFYFYSCDLLTGFWVTLAHGTHSDRCLSILMYTTFPSTSSSCVYFPVQREIERLNAWLHTHTNWRTRSFTFINCWLRREFKRRKMLTRPSCYVQ